MPILKIRRRLPCDSHGFAAPVGIQSRLGLNEREVLLFMATNKKQVLKRLLSLTLAVIMCFGFRPTPAQAATETTDQSVTINNVLALIEEYRNGTREPGEKAKAAGFTSYQEDSSYPAYDPKYRIVLPNGPMNGTECAKFAFAFSDDLFGDAVLRKVTDPKTVRPGDLIQFSTHWSIAVTAAYSVDWTDNPCVRTVDGGPEGVIGWGNVNMQLDGDVVAIFSRYSN